MYLLGSDAEKYFYFRKFLFSVKDRVFHKNKVHRAYVKWSGLSSYQAQAALRYRTAPLIIPSNFKCELNPKTGYYRISVGMTFSKKEFGISRALIGHYESAGLEALHSSNDDDKAKLVAWNDFMEATVVHELVHWGRKVKGIEASTYAEEEKHAQAFEKEAYGKVTTSPEPLCFQPDVYIPSE